MSRVRFEQFFLLCDSSQQKPFWHPDHCQLFNIKILKELLQKQFDSHYILNQQCAIDKAIIPSKGVMGSNSVCATSKVGYIKLLSAFSFNFFCLAFFEVFFYQVLQPDLLVVLNGQQSA